LLRPAAVDPVTGYRRYALTQLDDAAVIRRLRALDLPVEEIGSVLRGADAAAVLAGHRERIEARAAEAGRILGELGPARDVLYRIEVKDVPPQEVAFISGASGVREAVAELLRSAGEVGIGPPFAVCTSELEVGLPVAPGVVAAGRIEVRRDEGLPAASPPCTTGPTTGSRAPTAGSGRSWGVNASSPQASRARSTSAAWS
jgi:DNA-binding transcriptional MerR regulator